MENQSKAKMEFNHKLTMLQKEASPSLYDGNLKEIVVYEKLIALQEQLNKLEATIGKMIPLINT